MSTPMSVDTTDIDAHDCDLEPTGRGSGLDEVFRCTICGVTTTPRQGVESARRSRKR